MKKKKKKKIIPGQLKIDFDVIIMNKEIKKKTKKHIIVNQRRLPIEKEDENVIDVFIDGKITKTINMKDNIEKETDRKPTKTINMSDNIEKETDRKPTKTINMSDNIDICTICKSGDNIFYTETANYHIFTCEKCKRIVRYELKKKQNENKKKTKTKKIEENVKQEQMPVYKDVKTNIVYNEDCLSTMSRMKDDTVDYVFTSPPYNAKNSSSESAKYPDGYEDDLPQDEYFEWQSKIIRELIRVTKNTIFYNIQLLGSNKVALFRIMNEFREYIKDVIIWDKKYGAPAYGEGILNSRYEFIICINKNDNTRQFKDASFKRGSQDNVVSVNKQHNKDADVNKAVFPIALPGMFMGMFGKDKDIWYDPFCGTGTTGIAAMKYNKCYILSELSPTIYSRAMRKIKKEVSQIKLKFESNE